MQGELRAEVAVAVLVGDLEGVGARGQVVKGHGERAPGGVGYRHGQHAADRPFAQRWSSSASVDAMFYAHAQVNLLSQVLEGLHVTFL